VTRRRQYRIEESARNRRFFSPPNGYGCNKSGELGDLTITTQITLIATQSVAASVDRVTLLQRFRTRQRSACATASQEISYECMT